MNKVFLLKHVFPLKGKLSKVGDIFARHSKALTWIKGYFLMFTNETHWPFPLQIRRCFISHCFTQNISITVIRRF